MIKRYTCVRHAYIGNISFLPTLNNYCCWFLGLFAVSLSQSHLDSFDLVSARRGEFGVIQIYFIDTHCEQFNSMFECWRRDVFGRLEMNKQQRYCCSLFKVPLCMNIIVAIMRFCCRTLTKPIDSEKKLYSNQKHSIPFGLENRLIYLFVESTEKLSR